MAASTMPAGQRSDRLQTESRSDETYRNWPKVAQVNIDVMTTGLDPEERNPNRRLDSESWQEMRSSSAEIIKAAGHRFASKAECKTATEPPSSEPRWHLHIGRRPCKRRSSVAATQLWGLFYWTRRPGCGMPNLAAGTRGLENVEGANGHATLSSTI